VGDLRPAEPRKGLPEPFDELVLEAREDRAKEVAALVKEEMEAAGELNVPLVVDVGFGRTWGEAH